MVKHPSVLILTNEEDVTVDFVVRELRRRETSYLRLNTERFIEYEVAIQPSSQWCLVRNGTTYDLSDIRSIWHRRPVPPVVSVPNLTAGQRQVIEEQWRALLWGLSALPAKWINPLHSEARAESKLLQLATAETVGFDVPRTICTNLRSAALDFLESVAPSAVVIKGLHAPVIEEADGSSFLFTCRADMNVLSASASREIVPLIYQECIEPRTDIRVTVLGQNAFVASRCPSTNGVDWRIETGGPEWTALNSDSSGPLAQRCIAFLERLNLEYGAFDFAQDRESTDWFLECNPNGEWGWLEKSCRFGIPCTFADELTAPQ